MSKFENYEVTRLFTDRTTAVPTKEKHVLDVAGGSSLSEIFIIDDAFNVAARGQGELTATLAEGDYLVKYRAGDNLEERWVRLDRYVRLEPWEAPLPPSAAPISERTGWSEAEYDFADHLRRQFSLSIVVRNDELQPHETPQADDVRVLDYDGNPIANMKEPSVGWQRHTVGKVIGFSGSLPPGGYMLMVSTAGLRPYAMALWIAPQCSTQVFMDRLQLGYKGRRRRGPHLASASIFITNTYEPWGNIKPLLHAAETAKSVLSYDRPIVPSAREINRALDDKRECPSLGLLAAHLLRLRYMDQKNNEDLNAKSTFESLREVVRNLERVLPGSPDVGALQFTVGLIGHAEFAVPPMLAHSWAILQEFGGMAIPRGSYADRIRPAIAVTRPWLIFGTSKMLKRTEALEQHQGVAVLLPAHVQKPGEQLQRNLDVKAPDSVRKSRTAEARTHSWQIADQKSRGPITFEFWPGHQEMIAALVAAHPEHIRQVSARHSIGGGNDLTFMISLSGLAIPAISEILLRLIRSGQYKSFSFGNLRISGHSPEDMEKILASMRDSGLKL